MKNLNKENLEEFLEYYHNLHDSYVTNINYDVTKSQIELLIDVHWSGETTIKEDNTYETNKKKMRMVFELVEKLNIKESFSWDFIYDVYIEYIKLNNKEFICFATDETDPFVYIICENIKYEEI